METVYTNKAPNPVGPYSQAIKYSNMLFCSGQIAINPETGELSGDVEKQTEQVCKNIEAVLKAAGHDFSNVVKTTCFLTSMKDFPLFNTVYEKFFISKPARSCVAAAELPKGALVEIEVISVKE